MTLNKLLRILALIVFVLLIFGVSFCNMLALGLALYVASWLV